MPRVSLRDLLTTGRFGPVGLGATRGSVERAFGPPDDRDAAAASDGVARIWRYGDVELHFDGVGPEASLCLIHADYFSVPRGGPNVELDPWILSGALRRDVAERELTAAGLAHACRPYEYAADTDEIRTSSGVSLLFVGEEGTRPGDRVLVSMSRSSGSR